MESYFHTTEVREVFKPIKSVYICNMNMYIYANNLHMYLCLLYMCMFDRILQKKNQISYHVWGKAHRHKIRFCILPCSARDFFFHGFI